MKPWLLRACGISILLGPGALLYASKQAPSGQSGSSYSCAGLLSPSESTICMDPELSAYDRAVAWATAGRWKPAEWATIDQRSWLVGRDACGSEKNCILAAYREWLNALDPSHTFGPDFLRRGKAENSGEDLLLGSLQSPTGAVAPIEDFGSLSVQSLGEDWLLFRADATHAYDPHDGKGPNASFASAIGVVHLIDGEGFWESDPGEPWSCQIKLARLSRRAWRLTEAGGRCGGLGSTLTGIYRQD
jgi:hypothetical protein